MQVDRIEALLRVQPPDEPTYRREPLRSPPLAPARSGPVRGRRLMTPAFPGAAAFAAVAVVALALVLGTSTTSTPSASPSPSPNVTQGSSALGVIPWTDATPSPSPTPEPTPDPRTLPACTPDDLVLTAGGWGGATGSLAGGANVLNLTQNSCTVGGKPGIELLDSRGIVIAHGAGEPASESDLVVLPPGGVAGVIVVWGNWCGDPPARPLQVRLSLPIGGGTLLAAVDDAASGSPGAVPRCDSPGAGSSFGVPLPFAPPEPSAGGYEPEDCTLDALTAYLGTWGAAAGTSYATLAVLNRDSIDCLLPSSPAFELRDIAGRLLVATATASTPPILLPPGWAAIGDIGYADWCTPPPATPLQADLVVGSARLAVVARSEIPVPPCMGDPATPPPTLFYEAPLMIPGSPLPPETDPGDTLPVIVTLSALPATAPGATLDYTVTLTNISAFDKPLNLAALCPTYATRLILPGIGTSTVSHLRLNCDAAGVLAPNVPITFAMRLSIPADAPSGAATLVWQMGDRGPAAKATVTIAPP
jgi:hypothetical protein